MANPPLRNPLGASVNLWERRRFDMNQSLGCNATPYPANRRFARGHAGRVAGGRHDSNPADVAPSRGRFVRFSTLLTLVFQPPPKPDNGVRLACRSISVCVV